MKILVTGGLGYIGSHTVIELIEAGHVPVIIDNLSNSSTSALCAIKEIVDTDIDYIQAEMCNAEELESVFAKHDFDAVIHFAALKAVGESVADSLHYYNNNMISTINLCTLMDKYSVDKLIFSSSATVYGQPAHVPINELSESTNATNPYGQTKVMAEQILKDWTISSPTKKVICLRYFNPIGAHSSGIIGENPNGIPNNLLPYILKVAAGDLKELSVFGGDYNTPDGTGIRDYIHVTDVAKGHVQALKKQKNMNSFEAINLGTGKGTSVLEIIQTFIKVTGVSVPYNIVDRRPGDIAECYADPSKAKKLLDWVTVNTLEDACISAWNWQQNLTSISAKETAG